MFKPHLNPTRVWDKVISGSCKILVFVALEILLSYKIVLMGTNRPEGVAKFLCNVGKSAVVTAIAVMLKLILAPLMAFLLTDPSGEHGCHRYQSHRLVAQILWDTHPRRLNPRR